MNRIDKLNELNNSRVADLNRREILRRKKRVAFEADLKKSEEEAADKMKVLSKWFMDNFTPDDKNCQYGDSLRFMATLDVNETNIGPHGLPLMPEIQKRQYKISRVYSRVEISIRSGKSHCWGRPKGLHLVRVIEYLLGEGEVRPVYS